jgi:ABC-type multidrug transport system ATPase subunit
MILFLWVNKYKHLNKIGFNLHSQYDFKFVIDDDTSTSEKIKGRLTCKFKKRINLFNEQISDLKAIIGENGAGKTSIIEILVQNIMSESSLSFDGFIITEKYLFNRRDIDFGDSVQVLKDLKISIIGNLDLANFNKSPASRKIESSDVKKTTRGQIATSHLKQLSIIHYSPLLNIDKVENSEGLAGSNKIWETDYWHYYNFTLENTIIDDYHSMNIGTTGFLISSESELLAHKTADSKRNLEFLTNDIFKNLKFKNNIESVNIKLNDFYYKFWMSIDSFLKRDNELEGRIQKVIRTLQSKEIKNQGLIKKLESNLYLSFIYGALKYEYNHLMNFGDGGKSNAILLTIQKFEESAKNTRILKSVLLNFLNIAEFPKTFRLNIFKQIEKLIYFVSNSSNIKDRWESDFTLLINNSESIIEFIQHYYYNFIYKDRDDERAFLFHIFSIDYVGLSGGEKNLLSMFSRIRVAAETIPDSQSEVVFLLDEPEVTLHPQWQILFIKLLNENLPKLFPKKKLQILISSHSPILVSDLPKHNILFLEKDDMTGECKVSELKDMQNTFGANIHSLYADAFFLKDKGGAMGEFAKGIIKEVINELNKDTPENSQYLKGIIDMVGEPFIQNQLLELFYKKFPEQRIENIDDRIAFLEKELKSSIEIKERGSNEKSR